MEQNIKLIFDSSLKEVVLDFFDKRVKEGIIVEKSDPSQSVLSTDGQEVKIEEFGGIKKGSEVFIKNDLISLMRLSKQ